MKKRLLSLLLAVVMVVSLLSGSALAASGRNYGNVPIYVGYADLDYMAEEILKEIPTAGKSATEQIRAVYDWIILNCERYNWDGNYYFDENDVMTQVENYFYDECSAALAKGDLLIRPEFEESAVYDSNYDMYVMSYDSNQYIANFAYEMMLYRTGNCAHYAALLTLLLGHLGFDCRLIAGNFINGDGSQVEHKWNYVLVDGQYYWLDVRMDHANYESTGKMSYKYFMVADTTEWAKRHSWDDTYSKELAADAATVMENYGYSAALVSGEPWSRCSDWAAAQMKSAYDLGVIPEVLQNRDLTVSISRAEFAAVAVAMYEGLVDTTVPAYTGASPFSDTTDAEVLKAYSLGVVNGMGDGTFAPNASLTREQAVTMLGRVYELASTGKVGDGSGLYNSGKQTFTDDGSISAYARNYIYFFVDCGVINGMGDGTFAPKRSMTREEALKTTVEAVIRL